jgi:hypothetical protein
MHHHHHHHLHLQRGSSRAAAALLLRTTPAALLLLLLLAHTGGPAAGYPNLWRQCGGEHPDGGAGRHGAAKPDPSMGFVLQGLGAAQAGYCPGGRYTVGGAGALAVGHGSDSTCCHSGSDHLWPTVSSSVTCWAISNTCLTYLTWQVTVTDSGW